MRIAVDAMGGDRAPGEAVKGAVRAATNLGVEVSLVGDRSVLEQCLGSCGPYDAKLVSVVNASQIVGMDEPGATSVRRKRDASICVATRLVKDGHADAVVSAGNTGATLSAAMLYLRCIPGVERPGIASVFPTVDGRVLCLDLGANVDCRPRQLVDFAVMGQVYSNRVLGVERPRIGLLNIGEEECKGNEVTKEAYALLQHDPRFSFSGNCEGDELFSGKFDVVVCDGFVGNVVLKTTEGAASLLFESVRREVLSSALCRLAGLLVRPLMRRVVKRLAYEEYGGALLLGVNGVCVIGHGRSSAKAFESALAFAAGAVSQDIRGHIERSLAAGGTAWSAAAPQDGSDGRSSAGADTQPEGRDPRRRPLHSAEGID